VSGNGEATSLANQSQHGPGRLPLLAKPSKSELAEMFTRAALHRVLRELEIVDDILKANTAQRQSPTSRSDLLRKLGEPLQQREQKAAEQAVDGLLADLDITAQDVADQLSEEMAASSIQPRDISKIYPLSAEQQIGISQWVAERAAPIRDKFEQYLGKFADNPLQYQYAAAYLNWRGREPVDEILGAAMLPRLISSFEQFLAGLLRTGLTLHPKALGPYGDVPFDLTARFDNLSDIHRYMVDKKIEAFLSESPED
jgi:hypothetical protein